jgi:hypothetical protein
MTDSSMRIAGIRYWPATNGLKRSHVACAGPRLPNFFTNSSVVGNEVVNVFTLAA